MTFIPQNNNATHRRDLGLTEPWVPRERAENEALPPTSNIWNRPVYQPPEDTYIRPGAMDFKKIKSK